MVRKLVKKLSACVLAAAVVAGLTGCGSVTSGKRIVRISHAQSETHPEHLGLLAFKKYVEERLGDKYEVQIFPNELLGSAQKAIELTQTGAIDFVVAGTANLETFASVYEIFSMPYLFDSEDVYKSVIRITWKRFMSLLMKQVSAWLPGTMQEPETSMAKSRSIPRMT